MIRAARGLLVLLLLLLIGGIGGWLLLLRAHPQEEGNDLARLFNHGSIGNEEAQGIPYWIWRVLPQVFPGHLPNGGDGYGALGLYWTRGEELPVGLSQMTIGVIPRVSPNCAFCHQGSYRLSPEEPARLVTAGAGGRVEVQSYLRFLIAAGRDPGFTADRIMAEIATIADLPLWERALYRFVLIPATRKALIEQGARFAWADTRPDWGPGRIDPFNPVKFGALSLGDDGTIGNSDMMPLWDLGHLDATNTATFSLHWDGLLTDLHETVVAGAIGDGMTRKTWARTEEGLGRIEDFIRRQAPPPSPFSPLRAPGDPLRVEPAALAQGRAIYRRDCAGCHEPGGARYRQPIPIVELGTDRHRLDMWTPAARATYAAYEPGYDWGFRAFRKTEGYVAVGLRGLWLRGPYLHNGSVPTLAALLRSPAERPLTFRRGSDIIDPDGGFRSDEGWLYDTRLPGNGNDGHLWGTTLPEEERAALLAWLKTM